MPIVNRTIGITSEKIGAPNKGQLMDILIQNLSANNVYVGSNNTVTTANGVRIVPNGYWANDKCRHPVWIIADAVTSDVRINMEIYNAWNNEEAK